MISKDNLVYYLKKQRFLFLIKKIGLILLVNIFL